MGYSQHHRRHGRVPVGRATVVIACVLVVAINGWMCKSAAALPDPIPTLELLTLISIPWNIAAAWAMYMRKGWGRGMFLFLLYVGTVGYLMTWIAATVEKVDTLHQRSLPLLVGTCVYVLCTVVLSKSRDVHRLTSRALE
jgi:hypothetical protein